ncbi:MAG: LSU ribosomal protein L7AE [Pelotomaculum thermopropionicum]|uniref:LSU ribosomal protein L7AE n=1 Tax=Pelotomaculum thermopropionicum TaxID=110500 RepID=A0A101HUL9_9FIRM|nr:MAG: LSU ribosomal protein L7AE [Pelotomaculum thermopropionicum]
MIYSMIGFGQRAGKLKSGNLAVKDALINKKAKILIIAEDAPERLRSEFTTMAESKNIPAVIYGSKEVLGRLIGKSPRSVFALTEDGMARGILGALERGEAERT